MEQVTAAFVEKKGKQKYKVRNHFVTSNTEIKWHCDVKMTACVLCLCIFVWSEMSADWCVLWGWRVYSSILEMVQCHEWDSPSLHLPLLPHLDRMLLWSLHPQWPQSQREYLEQGSPNLFLEGRCPAEFSSNPNQTHLKQIIKVLLGILETSRQVCWGKLELNSIIFFFTFNVL